MVVNLKFKGTRVITLSVTVLCFFQTPLCNVQRSQDTKCPVLHCAVDRSTILLTPSSPGSNDEHSRWNSSCKTRVSFRVTPFSGVHGIVEFICTSSRYLLTGNNILHTPDDDAAEGTTNTQGRAQTRDRDSRDDRPSGPSRNKLTKEQKKAQRGANKGRKFGKVRDELDLCWRIANGMTCERGTESAFPSSGWHNAPRSFLPHRCRFSHDVGAYLAAKSQDIRMPQISEISNPSPFVPVIDKVGMPHSPYPSLDSSSVCPVFAETGECRWVVHL